MSLQITWSTKSSITNRTQDSLTTGCIEGLYRLLMHTAQLGPLHCKTSAHIFDTKLHQTVPQWDVLALQCICGEPYHFLSWRNVHTELKSQPLPEYSPVGHLYTWRHNSYHCLLSFAKEHQYPSLILRDGRSDFTRSLHLHLGPWKDYTWAATQTDKFEVNDIQSF